MVFMLLYIKYEFFVYYLFRDTTDLCFHLEQLNSNKLDTMLINYF